MHRVLRLLCLVAIPLLMYVAKPTLGADEAKQMFAPEIIRELTSRDLRLDTTEASSTSAFQAEFFIRHKVHMTDWVRSRVVVQRDGGEFAVAILAEDGIALGYLPSSGPLAVLDAENPGYCKLLLGRIHLRCGTDGLGKLGTAVGTSGVRQDKSRFTIDTPGLIERLVQECSASYDPLNHKIEFAKSNGSRAEITLHPDWRKKQVFPIQSLLMRSHLGFELGVTNIRIRTPPLRNIIKMQEVVEQIPSTIKPLPEGANSFPEFDLLCAEIDHTNLEQRRTGLILLSLFQIAEGVELSHEERQHVDALIAECLNPTSDRNVADAIHALQVTLEWRIARQEQMTKRYENGPACGSRYCRVAAAHRLEVALGPERSQSLYQALKSLICTKQRSVEVRVAAIDVLGVIGIRVDSSLLSDVAVALESEQPDSALLVALSSARIRNRQGTKDDVLRLCRALDDAQQNLYARFLALEALAYANLLSGHEEHVETVLSRPRPQESPERMNRFTRAVAETAEGKLVLARLLHQDLPTTVRLDVCDTLADVLEEDEADWRELMHAAESIATDPSASADIRQRAAHLAIRGRPEFEKEFFAAVFESDNPKLVTKAMAMLMISDRFPEGLPYINRSLDSPKVDVRKSGAIALTSYFRVCIAPSDPIPPDFYTALDKTLADTDARMRYIGVALIVFMNAAERVLPPHYVASVVEVIRKSDDRGQIAVAAVILEKLTNGAFRAGYPEDAAGKADSTAAQKWLLENAPSAKLAALRWADANIKTPVETNKR